MTATSTTGAPAVDRPSPPSWHYLDEFRSHVFLPRWSGSAYTLLWFAGVPAFGAWWRHREGAQNTVATLVIASVAAVMILGGLAWLAWDKAGREGYLGRVHRRALARGVTVHAYPTSFRVDSGGDDRTTSPALLLVDAGLPSADAGRLHAAFGAWTDRLAADPDATAAARNVMLHRRVVELSEIFGAQATGAWLARKPTDDNEHDSPWRLLILDPTHVEISDVLPLGAMIGTDT